MLLLHKPYESCTKPIRRPVLSLQPSTFILRTICMDGRTPTRAAPVKKQGTVRWWMHEIRYSGCILFPPKSNIRALMEHSSHGGSITAGAHTNAPQDAKPASHNINSLRSMCVCRYRQRSHVGAVTVAVYIVATQYILRFPSRPRPARVEVFHPR